MESPIVKSQCNNTIRMFGEIRLRSVRKYEIRDANVTSNIAMWSCTLEAPRQEHPWRPDTPQLESLAQHSSWLVVAPDRCLACGADGVYGRSPTRTKAARIIPADLRTHQITLANLMSWNVDSHIHIIC